MAIDLAEPVLDLSPSGKVQACMMRDAARREAAQRTAFEKMETVAVPTVHVKAPRHALHATTVLPVIELYQVRLVPTADLIVEAVTRAYLEHGHAPGVVYLSPLRLLTVPGFLWDAYPVRTDCLDIVVRLASIASLSDDDIQVVMKGLFD